MELKVEDRIYLCAHQNSTCRATLQPFTLIFQGNEWHRSRTYVEIYVFLSWSSSSSLPAVLAFLLYFSTQTILLVFRVISSSFHTNHSIPPPPLYLYIYMCDQIYPILNAGCWLIILCASLLALVLLATREFNVWTMEARTTPHLLFVFRFYVV